MKIKINFLIALIVILNAVFYCYADEINLEKIVVTPSRMEESGEYSGPVQVLNGRDLEKKGVLNVRDALKETGNLDMVQTGSKGGAVSIFMRGANSNHVLFFLDGVKFYDPMATNAAPDIAHLTLDNLERIEIVEGAKSSLYGSDAIGGVINMISRKGKGRLSISIANEGGSFYTHKHTIATQGEIGDFGFSSSTSYFRTKGISSAKAKNNNPEKDGYDNLSSANRFDYRFSDKLAVGTVLRYTQANLEYDDSTWTGQKIDDPNKKQFFRQGMGMVFAEYDLSDWNRQRLQASWMRNFRRHTDENDVAGIDDQERQWYDGTNYQINWLDTLKLADFDTLVLGFDWNREKGDSYALLPGWETDGPKRRTHTRGYYLENKFNFKERVFLNSGFRVDDHSTFGSHDTFSQELIWKPFSSTKLWGSYGQGFKSPSLYQLYDPSNGNIDLQPEKSSSYEGGIEQEFYKDKFRGGFIYFHNHFKNLIDWRSTGMFTGQYLNVSKARTFGMKTYFTLKPTDSLTLTAGYTWLDTENKEDHSELLRRAKNKASLSADYKLGRALINLAFVYTGHRPDTSGQLLKSYMLLNSSFSYELNKNLDWFVRFENMLNDKYEEVAGYGTPGFSAYSGIEFSF